MRPVARRDHARLAFVGVLLAACGDDGGSASHAARPARCDGCRIVRRALPARRGDVLDRRGVVLATSRAGTANPVAPVRAYPQGALAAHVLGYLMEVTEGERDRMAAGGYAAGDPVGRYGLERAWESYLRGKDGFEDVVVDAHGRPIDDPALAAAWIHGDRRVEPVAGQTLVLTLDADLQRLAEDAIAPHAPAAVAVVEVGTGKILALGSAPSFDPALMSGHPTPSDLAALEADRRRPFLDRTVFARYPPGATFEPVTAIAALEDGQTDAGERIACGGSLAVDGRTFTCRARHGTLDPAGALQRGCDLHVWQLARRVGLARIDEVAAGYGFGAPSGLGLNGDSAGRLPAARPSSGGGTGATLSAAAGQGDVEVTVLQLAMAYAALADDGVRHVPQLVARVEDADGRVIVTFDPRVVTAAAGPTAPEVLAVIRRGMGQAVSAPGGVAYAHGRSRLVEIAGQTGTAAVPRSPRRRVATATTVPDPTRPHAWFAGWAPAGAPEVAIVVLVEHGGEGGEVAAPLARAILEGWWTHVRRP